MGCDCNFKTQNRYESLTYRLLDLIDTTSGCTVSPGNPRAWRTWSVGRGSRNIARASISVVCAIRGELLFTFAIHFVDASTGDLIVLCLARTVLTEKVAGPIVGVNTICLKSPIGMMECPWPKDITIIATCVFWHTRNHLVGWQTKNFKPRISFVEGKNNNPNCYQKPKVWHIPSARLALWGTVCPGWPSQPRWRQSYWKPNMFRRDVAAELEQQLPACASQLIPAPNRL